MAVRFDQRRKHWFFRVIVTKADGAKVRLWGRPGVPPYQGLANNKTGAKEAEKLAIARAKNETKTPKRSETRKREITTFGDFAEGFYMPKMRTIGNKRKNKPATLEAKQSHLRVHLLPRFRDVRIDQIDETDIDDLKVSLGTMGRSPKTINNVLSTLHNVLKNAKKRKLITAVPEMDWLSKPIPEFDFFDFKEAERLLAGAAKVPEWECAVLLALKTGMRLGELRALRWTCVDLVAGRLTISRNLWRDFEGTPKNGRQRTIDLPPSAVAALKAHRHLRGERVFLDLDGRDYTIGTWRHGLYRSCKRAGLRVVGWHVLRHTTASHLVMRGESLSIVQAQLGHRTIQMTTRYAHLAPGATRAVVAKLDEPAPKWQQNGSGAEIVG